MKLRIGIGYDVHSLIEGCRLVLGGVDIPFDRGLSGWSDADCLVHAIIDALLGAAALGDIGQHFPPGELEYKSISSLTLLAKVRDELKAKGWRVSNIDATIVAEAPKLREYIDTMRQNISRSLDCDLNQVSIKAKTSEKMGFIGRGEGIAAYAVALIESNG